VRAQQLIQQQFDSLGGSSRSSDEGVAPVLDFSSAPSAINVQDHNEAQNQVQAVTPLTKYLPAALLRSK